MKDYLPTKEELEKQKQEYAESLIKTIHELAEKAWMMGIEIVSVKFNDNIVEVFGEGRSIYGDRYTIPAPKIDKVETDFMNISVLPSNDIIDEERA